MLMTKFRTMAVVLVVVGVLGVWLGARFVVGQTPGDSQPKVVQIKGLSAETQRENAAKWEYKAATFWLNADLDVTKQANDLAAEGWEYAWRVADGQVVFKRLKK